MISHGSSLPVVLPRVGRAVVLAVLRLLGGRGSEQGGWAALQEIDG